MRRAKAGRLWTRTGQTKVGLVWPLVVASLTWMGLVCAASRTAASLRMARDWRLVLAIQMGQCAYIGCFMHPDMYCAFTRRVCFRRGRSGSAVEQREGLTCVPSVSRKTSVAMAGRQRRIWGGWLWEQVGKRPVLGVKGGEFWLLLSFTYIVNQPRPPPHTVGQFRG